MRCNWYDGSREAQCPDLGQHILIYGCLAQHIGEIVFCKNHLIIWDEMAVTNRAWCPAETCSECVADWTVIGVGQATVGWFKRYAPQ
jgi:hypothetical protein